MLFKYFSQCTLNSLYQDSSFGIWPTVDVNLPTAVQGQFYLSVIDIKTPTTLIEASGGDSALTSFDTLDKLFMLAIGLLMILNLSQLLVYLMVLLLTVMIQIV